VFFNPPWEFAEHIGCHFESFRRTSPTSTMVVFILPKWAKFNELTRHKKLYREFPARSQLFTRESVNDPTKHEVVGHALCGWSTMVVIFTIQPGLRSLSTYLGICTTKRPYGVHRYATIVFSERYRHVDMLHRNLPVNNSN
jgi:hypothetical protein